MLNQVLKVSSGTAIGQPSLLRMRMLSKSVTFLDLRLSRGSVATYCRWGENTYRIFLQINWWKNFRNRSTFAKVIIEHTHAVALRCICADYNAQAQPNIFVAPHWRTEGRPGITALPQKLLFLAGLNNNNNQQTRFTAVSPRRPAGDRLMSRRQNNQPFWILMWSPGATAQPPTPPRANPVLKSGGWHASRQNITATTQWTWPTRFYNGWLSCRNSSNQPGLNWDRLVISTPAAWFLAGLNQ